MPEIVGPGKKKDFLPRGGECGAGVPLSPNAAPADRSAAIPGIGRYYVTSVQGRDYSTVMGITVLLSILIIVANMFVDIMYGILDPRTREARS